MCVPPVPRGGGKADAGSSRSGGGSKSRFGERSSGPTPAAAAALERIRNHRSSLPEKCVPMGGVVVVVVVVAVVVVAVVVVVAFFCISQCRGCHAACLLIPPLLLVDPFLGR
jgi:hypothetical protein